MRPSSMRLQQLGHAGGAADLAQAAVGHPEDPELGLALEALADHQLVALLEDVERDDFLGQENEPQREKRKAIDRLSHAA